MTLTVPKNVVDTQAVISALESKQRNKTAPEVKNLFLQTVNGWGNPPDFLSNQTTTENSIGIKTYSSGRNSDQYALVNAGSPRHPIDPLHAPWLRFQRGYTPSTSPRSLTSRPYQRSGPFTKAGHVEHPGFTAREFDQTIAEQYQDTFRQDMQDALNSAVARQRRP